jgi:hypothetical protein
MDAYGRRRVALNHLMNLFPGEGAGAMDVGKATDLMLEYAQTLPAEWVTARVESVSARLAELAGEGKPALDTGLKQILLNLLLFANAGDRTRTAEILNEALRGDAADVEYFRLRLVNWLVDKVVDRWPPLPDELREPREVELQPEGQTASIGARKGDTAGDDAATERLSLDRQTQTVTLDGNRHQITDPKAFAVYQAIASSCPVPLTKGALQARVAGCKGDKKIRQLLNGLPEQLRETVHSGPNGYWLKLDPLPNAGQ